MLLNTFQHIRGIGKKTEQTLWKKGATSWDTYPFMCNAQLSLFGDLVPDSIRASKEAYEKGDVCFFAESLPSSLYYRIGLTYPDETLFLDIETTGLSLYYDEITIVGWSLGRKFGVWVKGEDPSAFLETLKSAKVIVTFNGTLFDLKFLEKAIPGIPLPPVHIDLRFLAKRAGLSGGQKLIESKIGFKRPHSVEGMEGETAPILWYRYRRGDLKAFKRLVYYNHSDIEGMKCILDYVIIKTYELERIPKSLQSKPRFSKLRSKVKWAKPHEINNPYKIRVSKSKKDLKPRIYYKQLDRIGPLSDMVIVGIDLVSSEERESGYCTLRGNKAETCRMKSDEEMIRSALDAKANLISIDSPLSIPKGRTSFFDDDPQRGRFGIMRECERILKRRGINVYPCLIPSMQKLTRRGIILASKFRQMGIPVIESYPGAAQDIIGIPRKRAGMQYLADALDQFGIVCDFSKKISHDELDAITSAIVGLFFWTGKFEAIGNPEEEYLIIPDLNAEPNKANGRRVIGLSGSLPKEEKGLLSSNPEKYSCLHLSLDDDFEEKIAKEANSGLSCSKVSPYEFRRRTFMLAELGTKSNGKDLLISGIQTPEDHALMVEMFGSNFQHIYVEMKPNSLCTTAELRKPPTKYPQEYSKSIPNSVRPLADRVIAYDGTRLDLFSQIQSTIIVSGG